MTVVMMRRSCLGLESLPAERIVPAEPGVKIVQLVTDDPDEAQRPVCRAVSGSAVSGSAWTEVSIRARDLTCGGEFAAAHAALASAGAGVSAVTVTASGSAAGACRSNAARRTLPSSESEPESWLPWLIRPSGACRWVGSPVAVTVVFTVPRA